MKFWEDVRENLLWEKAELFLTQFTFFFFFLGEPTLFHSISGDRTWPMDSPWCVGQDSDHHGEGGTVSCDFEERGARLCPQPHPVCHHQWMLEHAKGNAVGFSSGLFSVEGNLKWNRSEVRCKLAPKFANISCSITIYAVKVLSGFRFELFTARPSWFSLWTKTSSGRWGGVHHLYGLFFPRA